MLPRVEVPEYNPESSAGVLKFSNEYDTKNVPYPKVAAAASTTLNLSSVALPMEGAALKEAASLEVYPLDVRNFYSSLGLDCVMC